LTYSANTEEACAGADVVLILTEWAEFRKLLPSDLDDIVRKKVVIDGRNCLEPAIWRDAGWTYRGLGRP